MTCDEFWESTPREFDNRMKGFYEYEDFLQKENWNRTRYMTEIIANCSGNLKKPLKLTFPWDSEKEVKVLTKEERQRIKELCDKAHGKTLNGAI